MYRLKLEFRSAVTVILSPHALQVLESLMMHTNNMTYLWFIDLVYTIQVIYCFQVRFWSPNKQSKSRTWRWSWSSTWSQKVRAPRRPPAVSISIDANHTSSRTCIFWRTRRPACLVVGSPVKSGNYIDSGGGYLEGEDGPVTWLPAPRNPPPSPASRPPSRAGAGPSPRTS